MCEYTITMPPYAPEFNPIERLFCTIKKCHADNICRKKIAHILVFLSTEIKKIPKYKFANYVKSCLS